MLVLGRRCNEEIIIDVPRAARIVVKVTDIASSQIKLGIDAPLDVQIWRAELEQRDAQQNSTGS